MPQFILAATIWSVHKESAIERALTKLLIIGYRKFISTEILVVEGGTASRAELRKYYAGFAEEIFAGFEF